MNQIYIDYTYKFIWLGLLIYQLVAQNSFLRVMVSESGKDISSKRCIAVSGMATFIYLCYYVTTTLGAKPLDGNIIVALVTIILTAAAIASIPQIMQLFSFIKGGVQPAAEKPQNVQNVIVKQE